MLSDVERAAYTALLARARANDRFEDEDVALLLPNDLRARFVAIRIGRENDMFERYDERLSTEFRGHNPITSYWWTERTIRDTINAQFRRLANSDDLARKLNGARQLAETEMPQAWARYDKLTEMQKLWLAKPGDRSGLPPSPHEEPPLEAVLFGEELPTAHALRRVLEELLGDDA